MEDNRDRPRGEPVPYRAEHLQPAHRCVSVLALTRGQIGAAEHSQVLLRLVIVTVRIAKL
jgi:hypothetical protein